MINLKCVCVCVRGGKSLVLPGSLSTILSIRIGGVQGKSFAKSWYQLRGSETDL